MWPPAHVLTLPLSIAALRPAVAKSGRQWLVAHSILVIAHHVIGRQDLYQELGANRFDQQRPEATTKRLVKRLENLGYQVSVQPQVSTPVA